MGKRKVALVGELGRLAKAWLEGKEQLYDVVYTHVSADIGLQIFGEMPDLVLLSDSLSVATICETLGSIKLHNPKIPVIVLTNFSRSSVNVTLFETGADDVVGGFASKRELSARTDLALKRIEGARSWQTFCSLKLHASTRQVECNRNGVSVKLTPREFAIFDLLVKHRDQAISRQALTRHIWQVEQRATPIHNLIDVHIYRLRKKLEQVGQRGLIQTVRDVGYVLAQPASAYPNRQD